MLYPNNNKGSYRKISNKKIVLKIPFFQKALMSCFCHAVSLVFQVLHTYNQKNLVFF